MRNLQVPWGGALLPLLNTLGNSNLRALGSLAACLNRSLLPASSGTSAATESHQQPPAAGQVLLQHLPVHTGLLQQLVKPLRLGQWCQLGQQQQRQFRQYHREVDEMSSAPRRVDRYVPMQQRHRRHDQQWSSDRSNHSPAAMLTASITRSETPAQLIRLFVENVEIINHIHVIAALTRAANLWESTGLPGAAGPGSSGQLTEQQEETDVQRQQLQQLLRHLAGPFARAMPHYKCREISSGLWSFAKCGQQVPEEVLTAVTQRCSSSDALSDRSTTTQHLVNLSWAAAHQNCKDQQLYAAIAAAAQQKLDELTASQLSVLGWTLARAGFADAQLVRGLADRAKQLLAAQLQGLREEASAQQDGERQRKTKYNPKQDLLKFKAGGLTGLSWAFGSAWRWPDTQLLSAVAQLAGQVPLVYDFKPHEASNLLKGFAIAAGAADHEAQYSSSTADSNNAGTASDSNSVEDSSVTAAESASAEGTAVESSTTGQHQTELAAAVDVVNGTFWPVAVTVASSVLRRQNEGQASAYVRILWSLAELQGQRQQRSPAAASEAPDGSVVFEQTCAAVHQCWRHQPLEAQSVVLAVWALVRAQESQLIAPLLRPAESTDAAGSGETSASSRPVPGIRPSQQLLQTLSDAVMTLASDGALRVYQLADLAAAFAKLQQIEGTRLLPRSLPSVSSQQQQQEEQIEQLADSSSSSLHQQQQQEATSVPGDSQSSMLQQQLLSTVDKQLAAWDAAAAAGASPIQQKASAAVAALCAAVEAALNSAMPGELRVQDVARCMGSLNRLQVHDPTIYKSLLQCLTPQQLQEANPQTLTTAIRAVSRLAQQLPQPLQELQQEDNDVLAVLLGLCLNRWGLPASSGGFDDAQRSSLRQAFKHLPPPFSETAVALELREISGWC